MPKAARKIITPPLPTPKKSQPGLRALTAFTKLPPGHQTFRVSDDRSAPHLNEREFAVIDLTDRELQHGELYVIQYEGGQRSRQVVQITSCFMQITETGPKQQVWWTRSLRGWRQVGECSEGIPLFEGLSDGPYDADALLAKLLGRVAGYALTALGHLLEPTAGWENELEGNAAFDASEYLDVLIAAGHTPRLMRGRDRHLYYAEMFAEGPVSDDDKERVMAARWKYVKASKALKLVIAECERRGLVEG